VLRLRGTRARRQRRDSGQPYLTHVVEVCRILLDLLENRIDTTLACATLLHDVVEDTDVTLADVEKQFAARWRRSWRA